MMTAWRCERSDQFSPRPGELCICPAYVWGRGVKYFVRRRIVECSFSEVSLNVFFFVCVLCGFFGCGINFKIFV